MNVLIARLMKKIDGEEIGGAFGKQGCFGEGRNPNRFCS